MRAEDQKGGNRLSRKPAHELKLRAATHATGIHGLEGVILRTADTDRGEPPTGLK